MGHEGRVNDGCGGGRGGNGNGDDSPRYENAVLPDGGDEGGDAHRVGILGGGQGSFKVELDITNRIFSTIWGAPSFMIFCFVFLCELRGPAWAVGNYSIGPLAGGGA